MYDFNRFFCTLDKLVKCNQRKSQRIWLKLSRHAAFALALSACRDTCNASKSMSVYCLSLRVHGKTSSANVDESARRLQRSVKVTNHSTIPCVRYSFLLVCNNNFVFKTRRFSDIRLQKCNDFEIRVTGHSRSLKLVSFDRLGIVSY